MALWMAYALVVGGLVGAAAVAAEWALRARGYPGRFAWTGAFVATMAVPALALFRPGPRPEAAAAGAGLGLPLELLGQGLRAVPVAPSTLERVEPWILAAWILATAVLGIALVGGLVRLSLKARRWPAARSGDSDVLLSDGFGPALLGLARLRVVVPRWALGLEPEQLRLVILHEEEHRRTGDARVLLVAALLVVAAPWNVALWWQLRRLRAALELDCDARVLRRGASPAAYGALLLELGSRIPGLPLSFLPVAALSNHPSLLERRLRMIVRGAKRHGRTKALLAGGGVLLLLALACEAPSPTALRPTGGNDAEGPVAAATDTVSVAGVVAGQVGEDPVVVVDGVIVQGRLADVVSRLDKSTIQSIEVIKGGTARAQMGKVAAGGIVRIRTTAGGDAEPTAIREKAAAEGRTGKALYTVSEDAPGQFKVQLDSVAEGTHAVTLTEVPTDASAAERQFDVQLEGKPTADTTTMAQVRKVTGVPDDGIKVDIDGKPFHGDLSTLDPKTIDQVEVVKSAAVQVIHITTKKAARAGGEES